MGFYILLSLFIVVPVAEIALLIEIGSKIGGARTILIVILTAILGAWLVRQQGFATITKVQQELNAGRVPAMQMAEGLALLIAGAVLLTPGFITDIFGFALLVPPVRQAMISWVAQRGLIRTMPGQSPQRTDRRGQVIEGEYRDAE